jgi:isoquinoline 1-oxidoreductase subunit alpha
MGPGCPGYQPAGAAFIRAVPCRPWVSLALNPGYSSPRRADFFLRALHFARNEAANRRNGMPTLIVNGHSHNVDAEPDTPLLWVLRDTLGLTGTKYGCGIAQCGACTVHIDGVAVRSCSVQFGDVAGKEITTIEGLAAGGVLHKVQQAWLEHDVPQCGYCQSGMIMAVADLLKSKPKPTDADIDNAITNICRCGTFQQVRAAIHAAANA